MFAIIAVTIGFNKSNTGLQFYEWLNSQYTPFQINFWVTFLITSTMYWIGGLCYMLVDLTGWPGWMAQYKLQPTKRITVADYKKVCIIVLRNQIFVVLPLGYVLAILHPLPTEAPLPGAFETLFTYIFGLLFEEAGFYYTHRAFHHPKLYKIFHKKHHEYTAPVALSSTYCTMTEHLFSNLLPIIGGLYLINSHISLMWMFFCSLELGTLATHSGYNMKYNSFALVHDWHHFYFTENYGPTGILDHIYGTNKSFIAWVERLATEFGPGSEGKARELINKWESERT